jgi:hypothetical protein
MTGNALTSRNANEVAAGGSYNPFAIAGAGASASVFVKFVGTTGNFTYGQNDEEIAHDTKFAADIMNSEWNWTFWWQGKVIETRKSRIWDDPRGFDNEPDELPEAYEGDMSLKEIRAEQDNRDSNFNDGWGVQAVFNMRAIDGGGDEFTFKLNNGVALKSFLALLEAYGRRFQMNEGLLPIVSVSAEKYKSKKAGVGWRWAPRLKITEWLSEADLADAAGDNPDAYGGPTDGAEDDQPEAEKPAERARGRRGGRGTF